jgi:predicted RNase H-like HicB family nuclease
MGTRNYLGIVEPGPQNWSISFPAFPGTVTTGDTYDELMVHARDALATVIEAMQEEGQVVPDGFDTAQRTPAYDAGDYRDPRAVVLPVEVTA